MGRSDRVVNLHAEFRSGFRRAPAARDIVLADPAERAWRDVQAAGGARPGVDLQDDLLKADMDRVAREQAADAQLDALKKKFKRKDS